MRKLPLSTNSCGSGSTNTALLSRFQVQPYEKLRFIDFLVLDTTNDQKVLFEYIKYVTLNNNIKMHTSTLLTKGTTTER